MDLITIDEFISSFSGSKKYQESEQIDALYRIEKQPLFIKPF